MSSAEAAVSSLPRRERVAILTGLVGVTLVSWGYLIVMALRMERMDMGAMAGMAAMGVRPWTAVEFVLMLLMWVVMMIGMMVPTAIPMTLIYAAVARKARREGSSVAPAGAFVGGYIVMWTLFSVGATLAQWGLDQAALLSPMMVTTSPAVGAALLVGAGVYQLTPWKEACLQHCRAPAHFIAEHWRPRTVGALRMGLHHGAFCLGCCWVLMGLLFFGGVMNLLWVAGITLFVLLEKVLPAGGTGGRVAGVGMIGIGVVLLGAWASRAT